MITINITRAELVEHEACDEGLAFFDVRFTTGETGPIVWTIEAQLKELRDPAAYKWLFWAMAEDLIPRFSMRGSDLSGAILSGANLSGSDLRVANLSGAYRVSIDPPIPGWPVTDGRLERRAEGRVRRRR